MSFQTSIPHRPGKWDEVRFAPQWALDCHQHVCINYSQEDIKRQLKKHGRSSKLNQYLSYKLHSSFKPTWNFFADFSCVLQIIHLTTKIDVGTGAPRQRQDKTRDKANMGNPKVKRDCVEISVETSVKYIPPGFTIMGVSRLWNEFRQDTVALPRFFLN